jgi:hypothetical protein
MQLVTQPMRSVEAGSCMGSLYVCVLISSVNTESVPAKNSAKRIQRGKLPIRARDVRKLKPVPGIPDARIGFLRTDSESSLSVALGTLPKRRRTTRAEWGVFGSKQVLIDLQALDP